MTTYSRKCSGSYQIEKHVGHEEIISPESYVARSIFSFFEESASLGYYSHITETNLGQIITSSDLQRDDDIGMQYFRRIVLVCMDRTKVRVVNLDSSFTTQSHIPMNCKMSLGEAFLASVLSCKPGVVNPMPLTHRDSSGLIMALFWPLSYKLAETCLNYLWNLNSS